MHSDKVALVTGGAQRIGAAMVRHLHAAGFKVIIHYRKAKSSAEQLAAELNALRPQSALPLAQDLCEANAAQVLMATIEKQLSRLDVLVNNASVFKASLMQDFNAMDFTELFTLHVQAPYALSLAAKPLLERQQGVIINITDIHAQKPLKNYGLYCQSKAALEMQTKVLARELAPKIRVNAIAPGAILWPTGENSLDNKTKQQILSQTPLQCHGSPLYVAQTLLALIENPFITGQIVAVDGGRSLGFV